MDFRRTRAFIERKFWRAYEARDVSEFGDYLAVHRRDAISAALGYRRAGAEPLFLERYLDEPIECAVSAAFGRAIARAGIVEIGNLASDNAWSMIALWGAAANDLGWASEVAVATLTRPLRQMFRRMGVPVKEVAAARPERLNPAADNWGSYFRTDPWICAGWIEDGQRAMSAFLSKRERNVA